MDNRNVIVKLANCCRLCLLDDGIKLHIFEEEGIQRQLALKIQTCFPILVIFVFIYINILFVETAKRLLALQANVQHCVPSLTFLTSESKYCALVCTMVQCNLILEFNQNVTT
jgi:hypothetical protein